MSQKRQFNHSTNDPFFKDKAYNFKLLYSFNSSALSPMCKAIDYYFDKVSFDLFDEYNKTSNITGGRPRYNWRRLFKIFLYSIYTGTSLRKLDYKFEYGSEFSYLNDGLEEFPKRSTISRFALILDEHITNIFEQFMHIVDHEIGLNYETIYVDGTYVAANNSKDKIVSIAGIKRSNKKNEQIILSGEATGKEKAVAAEKLVRNAQRMQIIAGLGVNSYGLIDKDAVGLTIKNNSYVAGYSVQLFEEANFGLIVHTYLSNLNPDSYAFPSAYKCYLQKEKLKTIVADGGYNAQEVSKLLFEDNVKFISVLRERRFSETQPGFKISDNFEFITCPMGHQMTKRGKTGERTRFGMAVVFCKPCHRYMKECYVPKKQGYSILVNLEKYMLDTLLENVLKDEENIKTYNMRNNICESPHGFIVNNIKAQKMKRIGRKKNQTILSLIAILYNLSRVITVKMK